MERRPFGESGALVSSAALGELLKRLRRAAVDGVVPEREFLQGVRVLAVDDDARERLRDELARLGLRVGACTCTPTSTRVTMKRLYGEMKKRETACRARAWAAGAV
ncbi:hypothetical protein O1157_30290 [Streptomyces albogriseolus]